jgi:predicted ATPase
MLNSLRIQNFKSWQDTGTIQFGAITGFFGTNSSGKTSILQFLLMLKQTVESSDRARILNLGNERSYVDLGAFNDIIHNRLDSGRIKFDIEYIPNKEIFIHHIVDNNIIAFDEYEEYNDKIKLSSSILYDTNKIYTEFFKYKLGNKLLGLAVNDFHQQIPYYSVIQENLSIINMEALKILGSLNPEKFYMFPSIMRYNINSYETLNSISFSFQEKLEQIYYLGPLREYPKRFYIWSGEDTEDVGTRGENTVAALLASKSKVYFSGPDFALENTYFLEELVAQWLKNLELIHSFAVKAIAPNRREYEVRVRRTAESAEVLLTDVGFGVSQLLPVLVLLFYVPEGSTIILEQPEIHLHPAVQAGLADVFIDAIKRRNVQIILESHSEHLLQRLQLRMAEKGLNPDKEFDAGRANLYFTSIEEGRSVLTPLQLDEYGNINNWPEGFFGDTLGDAAAKMKAEMKRKMQQ